VEHEYPKARIQDKARLAPILAGSIAFTRKIDEAAACMFALQHEVLKAQGMSYGNVVMSHVFMKDLNEFAKMNAIYGEYFKSAPPARATVEVARLPRDVKIEISTIAVK